MIPTGKIVKEKYYGKIRTFRTRPRYEALTRFSGDVDLFPENGAKSKVQLSRDGNSNICTRYNSALAKFIANVFSKLLSVDLYDKFCIANPERQQKAVEKFLEILGNKFNYDTDEPIVAKSMSLNELGAFLRRFGIRPQDSGANVLGKIFSISNVDKNKIASGDFRENLPV